MVTDKNGNPLLTLQDRSAEVIRCADVIGWGVPTLSSRLRLGFQHVAALKQGKREISDADLEWLQKLADAVAALPRPESSSELLRPVAPATDPAPAMPAQEPPTMPVAAVVAAIIASYCANEMPLQAVAQLALRLDILEAVQAALDAIEPTQPTPERVGRFFPERETHTQPLREREPFPNDAAMIA